MKNYLLEQYNSQYRFDLLTKCNVKNEYEIPKITKIVINMGLKELITNKNHILPAFFALFLITGQKPIPTKAKKSIAMFKLRKGFFSGLKITLRGELMYHFLFKLIMIILPKNKDFKKFTVKQFDKNGNFSLGVKNIFLFPEIEKQLDNNQLVKPYGFDISIVTNSKDFETSKSLINLLGIPLKNK